MWLKLITLLLTMLNRFSEGLERAKDKQAGRNEEKLDNLTKVEKRGKDADKIYSDPVVDDIDAFLLRKQRYKPPHDIK